MQGLTEQLAEDDRADLTPLIDCVFLLLIFFMVTTTFYEESDLFKVDMPKAGHAEIRKVEDATVVYISRNGQFALGVEYVPDDQLWHKLKEKDKLQKIKTLIIKGDKRCPYDKVIMAMDVAEALNVPEISLAVTRK